MGTQQYVRSFRRVSHSSLLRIGHVETDNYELQRKARVDHAIRSWFKVVQALKANDRIPGYLSVSQSPVFV